MATYDIDIYSIKNNEVDGDVINNRSKRLFDILVKEFGNQNMEEVTNASNLIFEVEDSVEDFIYGMEHTSWVTEMPIKIDMALLNELRNSKALSEYELNSIEGDLEYGYEVWAILNEYK